MARKFYSPNVGVSGRRRIVPIMGIDFIAGQIEQKDGPINSRYGQKPPSIGGRTRRWSTINFLHLATNAPRTSTPAGAEIEQRERFRIAVLSRNATMMNLQAVTQIQVDFSSGTIRAGVDPNKYATTRGWVMAVRFRQASDGSISADTDTWQWS